MIIKIPLHVQRCASNVVLWSASSAAIRFLQWIS